MIARAGCARIAFNVRPQRGPWGGGNFFLRQLHDHLAALGYTVTYRLDPQVDAVLLFDPRPDMANLAFSVDDLRRHRARHPGVRVMHRINECDQRKGTDFMDKALAGANDLADYTVFLSDWLCAYHAARWFDVRRPHCTIYNGADPAVFHPFGATAYTPPGPMRIVTHHWSDNPLKGFDVYAQVDTLLAEGRLPGFEFWVIGRWPSGLTWKAARTFPPAHGATLAGHLRQCHLYLTASRWEPGGMHHVEGAQCGLPLVYHEDGGGIVEAGRLYGVGFRDDVAGALAAARERYAALRSAVLARAPSGLVMCVAYERVLRALLLGGPEAAASAATTGART